MGLAKAICGNIAREMKMEKRHWSKGDLVALLGVLVAVLTCIAAVLVVPEFRRAIGLGPSGEPQVAQPQPKTQPAPSPRPEQKQISRDQQSEKRTPSGNTTGADAESAVAVHSQNPSPGGGHNTPSDSREPVITSVSPIQPTAVQTIFIKGTGFGEQDPFNGYSHFFRITNITQSNWVGGWLEPQRDWGDPFTTARVYVSSWTDSQIVIGGFPNYGTHNNFNVPRVFKPGDVIKIEVANPQKRGFRSPENADFLGAPIAKYIATVTH
jgi:hypothetical protein